MPIPLGPSAYFFTMLLCSWSSKLYFSNPWTTSQTICACACLWHILTSGCSFFHMQWMLAWVATALPMEESPSLLFLRMTQRGWRCNTNLSQSVYSKPNPLWTKLFLQMIIEGPSPPAPCIHHIWITRGEVPMWWETWGFGPHLCSLFVCFTCALCLCSSSTLNIFLTS